MKNLFKVSISLALCSVPCILGAKVNFTRDIRPILSDKCFACHGPDENTRKAKLRLDTREGAIADLEGSHALVPGKPDASELLHRITTNDEDDRMPPRKSGKKPLTKEQAALFRQWITEGARWPKDRVLSRYEVSTDSWAGRDWWSLQPLQVAKLPTVQNQDWVRNPIDQFILAGLETKGLAPNPAIDRRERN